MGQVLYNGETVIYNKHAVPWTPYLLIPMEGHETRRRDWDGITVRRCTLIAGM